MLRFACLGSGSEGNALLIEVVNGARSTRLLLDCGFSAKEIERRLATLSLSLSQIDAVLITHEHSDHIGSALTLVKRANIPLLMSWGTAMAVGVHEESANLQIISADQSFSFQDIEILPYTVPHDAREPLQFVFSDGKAKLGVLTDVGMATAHIIQTLGACHGLVLECNYDPELLAKSQYPSSLKARIHGEHGHLSNQTAADILSAIDKSRLKHIIAAHLSQQNNRPELAQQALAAVLGALPEEVGVASQVSGFQWRTC